MLKAVHYDIYEEEKKFLLGNGEISQANAKKNPAASENNSSVKCATKPCGNVSKRPAFKSSHRQYVEKEKLGVMDEVKDLDKWENTLHISSKVKSPRGLARKKQHYAYQSTDGCLIMHQRYSDVAYGYDDESIGNDTLNSKNTKEVHWQDIKSVDLSDENKVRDPNSFNILSVHCDPKKKVLCWEAEDDYSSEEEVDKGNVTSHLNENSLS